MAANLGVFILLVVSLIGVRRIIFFVAAREVSIGIFFFFGEESLIGFLRLWISHRFYFRNVGEPYQIALLYRRSLLLVLRLFL